MERSPQLIPVAVCRQMLPGSVAYARWHGSEHEGALAEFAHRFCHADGGAPAFALARWLKLVVRA